MEEKRLAVKEKHSGRSGREQGLAAWKCCLLVKNGGRRSGEESAKACRLQKG